MLDRIAQEEGPMARRVRDTGLESRTARARLKPAGKPYYRAIGEGIHLGYRKGKVEGKWVLRRYVGDQDYKVVTIAVADDLIDADGEGVLTFYQAQERARAIVAEKVYSGPYRVRDAIEDYLVYLGERGWGTASRSRKHILPALGDLRVEDLDSATIRQWHRGMSDGERPSQASANRVLQMLKGALNRAFKDGKVASDGAWRRVEPFKNANASRTRYLTLEEVSRFLNACEPKFRLLARGALETGARYGELCRLRCRDFNRDAGTLHVKKSKTGIERHIVLTDDGRSFFEQLTVGQPKDAPLFGKEWRRDEQFRWMNLAVKAARIDPAISFHGLRHTWASLSVMSGMPLMIVARNLGHSTTKQTEKNYAHLAPSYLVEQIRQHAPKFGKVASNVKPIR
jgi:integrase